MSWILVQIYDGPNRRNGMERFWAGTKKGDVIDAFPDEMPWNDSEKMRAHFRILSFPGLHVSAWYDWLEPMYLNGKLILKRKYYVTLEAPESAWLRDVLNMGYALQLDPIEQVKFLALKRARATPLVINGYGNH